MTKEEVQQMLKECRLARQDYHHGKAHGFRSRTQEEQEQDKERQRNEKF